MPLLGFAEQRFHPHRAFPHRLRIVLRGVVAAHPLAIVLVEMAVQLPPLAAIRAAGAEGAGLAGRGRRLVDADPGAVGVAAVPEVSVQPPGMPGELNAYNA